MAEAIARDVFRRRGLAVTVASAGLCAPQGAPASPHAALALEAMGLEIPGHQARQADAALLEAAGLVLAMTDSLKAQLLGLAPNLAGKVWTLGEYAGAPGDVADPYGGGLDAYISCAADLRRLIETIAEGDKLWEFATC
jgi:protein-tyrosine-phosphatase